MREDASMSHYEGFRERWKNLQKRKEQYYRFPENFYVKPFKIIGNVYYVGDAKVCSHLVDSGEGLILIDTGYIHTAHMYINAIWEAGFNPKDVKFILHTHGHYDHYGATVVLQRLYACKAFLSRADARMLKDKPEVVRMLDWPYVEDKVFTPDFLMDDGDTIRLGNTSIRVVATPGHTEGTVSFFFNADEDGRTYHLGLFGGAGFTTLYKEYLIRYGMSLTLRDDFFDSIERLKKEQVDVVLGNHPGPNRILEKMEKKYAVPNGPNPFVDPDEWQIYLELVKSEFEKFLANGN
jgi:metallo-beta-lactamase class B